jgi:hypothetical protein
MELPQTTTPERKEWRAPSLTRLDVSAETQIIAKGGSIEDGGLGLPPLVQDDFEG